MNLLNLATAAILFVVSGRSSVSGLPVPTTPHIASAESRTLNMAAVSTPAPVADRSVQCREVNSVFVGGYRCTRTSIEEGGKLGQDRKLVTNAVTVLIPVADGKSGEISLVLCTPANSTFAGGYFCNRTPTSERSNTEQDHNPVPAGIPVADISNGGRPSSVQCNQVSSGFAGGYVCGRPTRKPTNK
jgi:hypothetical protein